MSCRPPGQGHALSETRWPEFALSAWALKDHRYCFCRKRSHERQVNEWIEPAIRPTDSTELDGVYQVPAITHRQRHQKTPDRCISDELWGPSKAPAIATQAESQAHGRFG